MTPDQELSMAPPPASTSLLVLARVVALATVIWLVAAAGALADETVQVCGSYANHIFVAGAPVPGIRQSGTCPNPPYTANGFGLDSSGTSTRGQSGRWQADAPAGLAIVGASTNSMVSAGLNSQGGDFGGGFYWAGGGVQTRNGETAVGVGPFFSGYFGFQLVCGVSKCTQPAQLDIGAISLYVRETSGPSFAAPTGLWQASGWVRGSWPFFAWGNSPSGLCSLSASLNGQLINTSTAGQDVSSWHQCAAPPISQPVDTTRYGQGAVPLTLSTGDAAGVPASLTKTVYIDNQQPGVALSGPADAASTAGTQVITATASAGPSNVAGMSCSVDGGPGQWYASSSAQVPVTGIGEHVVRCFSEDNAVDGNGVHGTSPVQSFSIKIGVPTITGIAFSRIVDKLRCRGGIERVKVPARWVTIHRHHKRVRIHRQARTRLVKVTRCHARTVRRRRTVWITVHRHGKPVRVKRRKTVRVIVAPHAVLKTHRRVGHGRATTVSGWLGTYTGVALGGQTVEVLSAPDNGQQAFTPVALATTAANGSWSARLPAGPSRLVEAAYGGGPDVEPSLSGVVREIVPARVELLSVSPRRVAWGGTVRLVGQLKGGYLPAGGTLVRLRIGLGSSSTTYGVHEHVGGNGRFATTYTFGAAPATVYRTYSFQTASLPMGSYPFAPAQSGRRYVIVGGHPAKPPPPRRHRHHKRTARSQRRHTRR
jgi:hypothetical protein